ncbi:endopeptidase La, partial [Clostridium perfringens]
GYTELEKLQIANRYLLPKQKSEHGLAPEQLILDEEALMKVIREYTRESGVRNLEQQVAALCRKAAKQIVTNQSESIEIKADDIKEYLGIPKFRYGMAELEDQVGTVTGLAWTEVGGETLTIEVTVVPGTGKLIL